jgi:hypothetical protein
MKLAGIAEFLENFICLDVFTVVHAYTKSLHGAESVLRSYQFRSYSRNPRRFVGHGGSLQHSKEPVTTRT